MDMNLLISAAQDRRAVSGPTHDFYRYPARFSPAFASAAIESFSKPGDIVLDPYMGGGTTIIEALARGRRAIGIDINSLAVFLVRTKTTFLNHHEKEALRTWGKAITDSINYRHPSSGLSLILEDRRALNLWRPDARGIKKGIGLAIASLAEFSSERSKAFARCVILKTAQWAIDGRRRPMGLDSFRTMLTVNLEHMLRSSEQLAHLVSKNSPDGLPPTIVQIDSALVAETPPFSSGMVKADLVVTSPPYPGVHVLYHRWQVNGRREAPAPYWITGCEDGHGQAFYTFADRRACNPDAYFRKSLQTLKSIRQVTKQGAHVVQMLAFSDPSKQLPWYLRNMEAAGFKETRWEGGTRGRIWRSVPNRKWHAALKGQTNSAKEVVLIHRAV